MATAGKARLFKVGKRSLRTTGKAQIFTTSGRCSECCTPYVLASFVTNSSNPTWNLVPYQGPTRGATEFVHKPVLVQRLYAASVRLVPRHRGESKNGFAMAWASVSAKAALPRLLQRATATFPTG
jgi:hypothetical protein